MNDSDDSVSVLIFSRTAGWRHDSIEAGVASITAQAPAYGMTARHSEDPALFTDATLADVDVVVFLNTTGTLFDASHREAFERFIRGGGGFVGIHSAADTEYDWPWYGRLVGAYFDNHPHVQEADVIVEDGLHPATRHLPERWTRADEWYNFRQHPRDVQVLLRLDASTFEGGTMGSDHPIAWSHEFDGGRSFYTAGGHTSESFSEPAFIEHVMQGILWAAGRTD